MHSGPKTPTRTESMAHTGGWRDAAAGATAGAVGRVVEQPFDTIKVRLQLGQPLPRSLRELYRGLPAPLVAGCAEACTLFTVYRHVLNRLGDSFSTRLLAGGAAGAAAATFLTPLELLKCRAQSAASSLGSRKLGLMSVYRGHSATLAREIPGTAAWFSAYNAARAHLSRDGAVERWHAAAAGAVAGVCYWLLIYPFDTIKTHMQVHDVASPTRVLRSQLMTAAGALGLYKGLGATLCRACPANAAIFFTYDALVN
jgi:hypothetical protein